MNRLLRPTFFDDNAGLDALAANERAQSYPALQPHVLSMKAGYVQYLSVSGNAAEIQKVALPPVIVGYLKAHFAKPPKCIQYIKRIREESGVNACPMCGSMHSGTLDHLMPRADYPVFSIFGPNLVPACKCNSLRSTALLGAAGERILHPYFDDILGERILRANFTQLGAVPRVSLHIMTDPAHADIHAVRFHVRTVVERTQILDYLRRSWGKLIRRPSSISAELRYDPVSRAGLVETLTAIRNGKDDFHDGPNNWESVFISGLLEDPVVDWLYAQFSRAGRGPDSSLAV